MVFHLKEKIKLADKYRKLQIFEKESFLWVLKDLFHSWMGHMYAIDSLTLPNMLSRTKKLLTGWVETWHSYIPLSRFCRYFICKCIRAFDTWLFYSVLCHLKYPLICGWIINGLISVICSVGITTHGQYMQVCMPYPRDLNNSFQVKHCCKAQLLYVLIEENSS